VSRGAFGAHVAMVLRRLVRICLYYSGRCPQFICCSATIRNPNEHIRKLLPIDSLYDYTTDDKKIMKLTIVDADMDGSPQGERYCCIFSSWSWCLLLFYLACFRTFVVWNPYCQNKLTVETTQTSEDRDGATPIVTCEAQTKPEAIRGVLNSNNLAAESSHSQLDEFLGGCVDRPVTIGQNSSAVDTFQGVQYVGGWKRRRPLKASKVSAQEVAPIKSNSKKKRVDADRLSSLQSSDSAIVDGSHGSENIRRSTIFEGSQLLSLLVKNNIRTLAFCKVRKLVELVLKYTIQDLEQTAPHLKDLVASYRGGYTMKERRCIEADLFSGKLIGVTATCALELGIDIVRFISMLLSALELLTHTP
jgi:Lhr-like helicase